MPAADLAELGPSIDSELVTILCQVMVGSRALGTMYNHSSVMYNPAQVSGMFRVCDLVGSDDKLRHNIVRVYWGSTRLRLVVPQPL